ncbi:hypothetical protein [Mucilaginibacter gilvus]|uniref:Uncharacterized protein n=1 Tax=Mucilaginibacter gilvus TaxID=2305909 RepID=A0A3S3YR73_9SPHI|nr:hypothetical protein [Mucilaginibacter gilvus]RWY48556.1 hypothetical protein EPL05_19105 [Mucilaginibacter gilvus]
MNIVQKARAIGTVLVLSAIIIGGVGLKAHLATNESYTWGGTLFMFSMPVLVIGLLFWSFTINFKRRG